jgi:PAS domain S-box-containing protein
MSTDSDKNIPALSADEQLSLFEDSPVVIYTGRPDGDFGATFVSSGIRNQLGWEPGDFVENAGFWASLIHPDDADRVFAGIHKLFEHDRHSHQYRFRHKDGSYRWMNDDLKLERDAHGTPVRIVGYWTDITAQKQAELSDQHLAAIVENSADAIITTDLGGIITSWNAGAENAYGYSEKEAVGKSVIGLIAPEGRAKESEASLRVGEEGLPVKRFETVRRRRDGTLLNVLVTISPIKDPMGNTVEISGIHHDITERKHMEAALRAREAELRLVTDAMPALIFYMDIDLRIRFANKRAAEWFGIPMENILGRHLWDLRGDEATETSRRYVEKIFVDGEVSVEQAERIRDGEVYSYEAIRVPDIGADGKVRGYFALVLDITERKQMEAALRESEERNLDLLEGSNFGIQIGSQARGRLFTNPALAELFGYGPDDELLSILKYGLIGEIDRDRIVKYSKDLYDGICESLTYEFDGVKKDGSVVPVQVFARRIFWDGEYAIQRTFVDLTDRKHAEEQLRQAQKMEAVGQLTGGIAHEFNNLLMVIVGNVERALDSGLDDDARKWLSSAMRGAMRGAELTNQLLAFSRKKSLKIVELDPNDLVRDMHEMLQRTLGETISVEISLDAAIWPVRADATMLESVLLNLALNARDAMPRGGEIRIITSNRMVDGRLLADHPNVVPGEYVMLEVSDSGTGMTPEILEHALEPFFTTKDVGQGTGLGLSMIDGFTEQSGGFLHIESLVNRGTSVRIYLPRGDLDNLAAQPAGARTGNPPVSQPGATVLVVEDDPAVREIVVGLLSQLGCNVIEAADGMEALARLEEVLHIDVLFTDMVLPGALAGPDIAGEALQRVPDLKVIFTSGYPDGEVNEMAAMGQQPWFIRKPYRISELAELFDRVLKT